jgi:hypothetical protein
MYIAKAPAAMPVTSANSRFMGFLRFSFRASRVSALSR